MLYQVISVRSRSVSVHDALTLSLITFPSLFIWTEKQICRVWVVKWQMVLRWWLKIRLVTNLSASIRLNWLISHTPKLSLMQSCSRVFNLRWERLQFELIRIRAVDGEQTQSGRISVFICCVCDYVSLFGGWWKISCPSHRVACEQAPPEQGWDLCLLLFGLLAPSSPGAKLSPHAALRLLQLLPQILLPPHSAELLSSWNRQRHWLWPLSCTVSISETLLFGGFWQIFAVISTWDKWQTFFLFLCSKFFKKLKCNGGWKMLTRWKITPRAGERPETSVLTLWVFYGAALWTELPGTKTFIDKQGWECSDTFSK